MSGTIAAPNDTCRVMIVEGMELLRVGLAGIIGDASGLVVCAATGDYREVESLIDQHRPHLLIAEPFQGTHDGLMWIKDVATRFPEMKILVATSNAEATYAERALRAGAAGYWMKNGTTDELLQAIQTVLAGELYVSPGFASLAVHKLVKGATNGSQDIAALTDRELHVFTLIAAGHGSGRIAQELGISRKTVETHCEHIKRKLAYRDAEALKRGARRLLAARNQ